MAPLGPVARVLPSHPRYDACLQVCPSSAASGNRTHDYGSRNWASSRWGTPQMTHFLTVSPFFFSPPLCDNPMSLPLCVLALPLPPSPPPSIPSLCRNPVPASAVAFSSCRRRLLPLMLPRTLHTLSWRSCLILPCVASRMLQSRLLACVVSSSLLLACSFCCLVLVHVLLDCSPAFSCRRGLVLLASFCVPLSVTPLFPLGPDAPVQFPCVYLLCRPLLLLPLPDFCSS